MFPCDPEISPPPELLETGANAAHCEEEHG